MCTVVASIFNRRSIDEGFGTVDGVELPSTPECHGTSSGEGNDSSVLVADVSSNFLRYAMTTSCPKMCVDFDITSRKIDISKHAVIFGGAVRDPLPRFLDRSTCMLCSGGKWIYVFIFNVNA